MGNIGAEGFLPTEYFLHSRFSKDEKPHPIHPLPTEIYPLTRRILVNQEGNNKLYISEIHNIYMT